MLSRFVNHVSSYTPRRLWVAVGGVRMRAESAVKPGAVSPTPISVYCTFVPAAVVTSVALRPWLPGHHARNQPLARLAVTRAPLLSLSVTPVTPAPVRPTTIENCLEPSSGGVVLLPEEA